MVAQVRGCLPSLSGEDLERVEQQMERVARALTIKENEGWLVWVYRWRGWGVGVCGRGEGFEEVTDE